MPSLGALSRLFRSDADAPAAPQVIRSRARRVHVFCAAALVTVRGSAEAETEVVITRKGADGGRLQVVEETREDGVVIRVPAPAPRFRMPSLGVHGEVTVPVTDGGVLARGAGETADVVTVIGAEGPIEAWAEVQITLPIGRRLELTLGAGLCRVDEADGHLQVFTGGAELRATKTRGHLEVRTATGDAKVRHFRGTLEVHTMSGDVSLFDTEADRIVATSEEGSLRGALLRTTALAMHADQGSLALDQVRAADVALTANAGDMDVTITSDVSVMSLRAKLGSIKLTMPETVNVTVQATTPFGRVTHDLPLEESEETHTGLVGRLGTGAGRAFVEATTGDIHLERLAREDDDETAVTDEDVPARGSTPDPGLE